MACGFCYSRFSFLSERCEWQEAETRQSERQKDIVNVTLHPQLSISLNTETMFDLQSLCWRGENTRSDPAHRHLKKLELLFSPKSIGEYNPLKVSSWQFSFVKVLS